MVIVLPAQAAVTPAGNPVGVPMPVAPVVVCVMFVNAVLIHKVGVLEAAPAVMFAVTVPVPVATFFVVAPVDVTVTLPLAPLLAELVSRTYMSVDATEPELGVSVTVDPKPLPELVDTS